MYLTRLTSHTLKSHIYATRLEKDSKRFNRAPKVLSIYLHKHNNISINANSFSLTPGYVLRRLNVGPYRLETYLTHSVDIVVIYSHIYRFKSITQLVDNLLKSYIFAIKLRSTKGISRFRQ